MKEFIRKLTGTYGPSGNEERVRDAISAMIRDRCDCLKADALGNLIAFREGRGGGGTNVKKIMLAAHMDEIGLIVTDVDKEGFLRVAPVGGMNPYTALGQRFVFANGRRAAVWMEKIEKMGDLASEKMYMDAGAGQPGGLDIQVGDMAVFDRQMEEVGGRLTSKAMDDRVGCAVLVETMKRLGESPNDLYFVFTVQEEVGARGAATSAYGVYPDMAIAVDVTLTGDTPKAPTMSVSLGKGAAIKVKDSNLVAHQGVRRLLVSVAEKAGIPHQMEVLERGGTDAGPIHTTREGVPSGVVSIPTRYVHTPCETVDLGDVEACVSLLQNTLKDRITI